MGFSRQVVDNLYENYCMVKEQSQHELFSEQSLLFGEKRLFKDYKEAIRALIRGDTDMCDTVEEGLEDIAKKWKKEFADFKPQVEKGGPVPTEWEEHPAIISAMMKLDIIEEKKAYLVLEFADLPPRETAVTVKTAAITVKEEPNKIDWQSFWEDSSVIANTVQFAKDHDGDKSALENGCHWSGERLFA